MEPSKEEIMIEESNNLLKSKLHKLITAPLIEFGHTATKLAKDDPRRVVHGVKVGLAITLISLLYYSEDLFEGFGVAAMWAVLTVVAVFEFSVGATLGKGLNRVLATLCAGLLGVGAHYVASLAGDELEPLILGFFVFILAAVVTFLRFFPKLKARYDYGLMVVILTFSLVCVTGYRDDEVVAEAQRRISTIFIGSFTAVAICILICPVWAGNDLHKCVADNIAKLAYFLHEVGSELSKEHGHRISDESMAFIDGVLNSKSSEDSLVNYAKWEPPHGRFKLRHPWKEYQKIGNLTRQLASIVQTLNLYIHAQNQPSKEVKEEWRKMSWESSKALMEVSEAMKNMSHPPATTISHLHSAKEAARRLHNLLRTSELWADHGISDVIPLATVASLLLETVSSTDRVTDAVQQLAKLACFRNATADEAAVSNLEVVTLEEGLIAGSSPSLEIVDQISE